MKIGHILITVINFLIELSTSHLQDFQGHPPKSSLQVSFFLDCNKKWQKRVFILI